MNYLIIGNSAAGLNGAEAIRSRDAQGNVTIVSEEDYPAYSRCLIPYFMEGKIREADMLYRPKDYYAKNRFEICLGQKVLSVQPREKTITMADGRKLAYDKLLIATGGSPKLPEIPGISKAGAFGFRTTLDLRGIMQTVKSAEHSVVMGGGCVGLMAACGLHALGLKVAVVISSSHLLSQIADAEAGEIIRRRFEENGVSIHAGTDVAEVLGNDKVSGVKLANGKQLDCQLVVVGKGVNPNIELVRQTEIRTHWGIVVDDELRTTVPDVYAAGDVAETRDVVTGDDTINAIWPAAAEQGWIAGANMTGAKEKYAGSMRMNSAEFFGLPLISIGIVKPRQPGYTALVRHVAEKNIFRKVVLRDNVVVGVVLVGEIENAGVYAALMRKKVDVTPIKQRLLDSNFGFADVLPLVTQERDKYPEPEYREAALYAEV